MYLISWGQVQINKKKAKIILLFIIFTVPWGWGTQHTTHNSSGEALEAEGERNSRQTPLLWFLCKRNGEAQQVGLELTSLNNFCGLCSTEAVLGCLAFNPGEFRSGIKWTKVRKEGRWDYGINWLLKKRNWTSSNQSLKTRLRNHFKNYIIRLAISLTFHNPFRVNIAWL